MSRLDVIFEKMEKAHVATKSEIMAIRAAVFAALYDDNVTAAYKEKLQEMYAEPTDAMP